MSALVSPPFVSRPVSDPALLPFSPASEAAFRDIELVAADGARLAARHFAPDPSEGDARGAVLIAPAMGVPQRFYQPLSTWLAARGFHVLTFDYRGSGESRVGPLRRERADILTWAEQDTAAALRELAARAPSLPITWLGHSLGGQVLPFVPGHERVAKVVTVATGSGYWRQNSAPLRRKVRLFWWGLVPVLTPLFGYFPGARIGIVGDLPKGVIRQWRRWCLDPEYVVGVLPGARERFAAVDLPITSLSFSDDEMMSAASIATLHGFFSGAERRMQRWSPADLGLARVGHFGFFRREMQVPLWQRHLLPELAIL